MLLSEVTVIGKYVGRVMGHDYNYFVDRTGLGLSVGLVKENGPTATSYKHQNNKKITRCP